MLKGDKHHPIVRARNASLQELGEDDDMSMSEDEVRQYLLTYYTSKNEYHRNNIQTIVIVAFGAILSDKFINLPSWLQIPLPWLLIPFLPLILFFLIRSRYWSDLAWAVTVIKPDDEQNFENPLRKDNLFYRFSRACVKETCERKSFGISFKTIHSRKFRYTITIALPIISTAILIILNLYGVF